MQRISGSLDDGRITFGEPRAPIETERLDPVCGMLVEPSAAAAATDYQGETYFFCSRSCKERFAADPELFAPSEPGLATDDPIEPPR